MTDLWRFVRNAVGKTIAYTSIRFLNAQNQVFARGSHTKYIALAWKDPNNIVEELSPSSSSEPEKKQGTPSGGEKNA